MGNATLKGKEKEVAVFEVLAPVAAAADATPHPASGASQEA
jgi:hypothetical protein